MFRIGSLDCKEHRKICDKEDITAYPSYKIYPPVPIPAFLADQDPTKEVNTDTLKKQAYKYVGNRVIDITSNNIDTFLNDNPGKPKMLLFTETKTAPMVYRALSTHFDVSWPANLTPVENPRVRYDQEGRRYVDQEVRHKEVP